MKKILSLLLCAILLTGCNSTTITNITSETNASTETAPVEAEPFAAPEYVTRFDTVTEISLSDEDITIDDSTKNALRILPQGSFYL